MRRIIPILLAFIITTNIFILPSCSESLVDENNRFMHLLSMLPATAKNDGLFALIDYELWFQDNGISLYDSNNQKICREDFFDILLGKFHDETIVEDEIVMFGSYFTGWSQHMLSSPIQNKYVGYDITNVIAEINNQAPWRNLSFEPGSKYDSMPLLKVAAFGKYNPDATVTALNNQDDWPSWAVENYNNEIYKDFNIYNWNDGDEMHLEDRKSPPNLDTLGRARPFSVSDTQLFVGNSVQDVKSMIDSSLSEIPSLADVPEYALLVEGLYDLGVRKAAIIGDEAVVNGYWGWADGHDSPQLKKFLTFGTGYGQDEKGSYIALVLVHEDSNDAQENSELLAKRVASSFINSLSELSRGFWSEFIYNSEFNTEGRVLLAKLYTNDQELWLNWFIYQSDLLWHEQ